MSFLKYNINYNLNDPRTTLIHRDIIKNKIFLKKLYEEWYRLFIQTSEKLPNGKLIEIGSGGGFLKELCPKIITSDIQKFEHCDLCFSAEKLPFNDEELSGIFMINVLHHIPHAENFFNEASRTLISGGKIIMIEPANTCFSRFIFRNFHHEAFEPAENWEIISEGRLSGANDALPWIIFKRDIEIFKTKYPDLKIVNIKHHTPFRYLISGGVSMKSIVPGWSFGFFTQLEKLLNPLSDQIGMFMTITIEKY